MRTKGCRRGPATACGHDALPGLRLHGTAVPKRWPGEVPVSCLGAPPWLPLRNAAVSRGELGASRSPVALARWFHRFAVPRSAASTPVQHPPALQQRPSAQPSSQVLDLARGPCQSTPARPCAVHPKAWVGPLRGGAHHCRTDARQRCDGKMDTAGHPPVPCRRCSRAALRVTGGDMSGRAL